MKLFMRVLLVLFLVFFFKLAFAENWTLEPGIDVVAIDVPSARLKLLNISSIDDHISAIGGYASDKNRPTNIKVTQDLSGKFWPEVLMEVSNDIHGGWHSIGERRIAGKASTLSNPKINQLYYLDLDAFRPNMKRYKFGKMILSNGEFAIFELKHLRNPHKYEKLIHPDKGKK